MTDLDSSLLPWRLRIRSVFHPATLLTPSARASSFRGCARGGARSADPAGAPHARLAAHGWAARCLLVSRARSGRRLLPSGADPRSGRAGRAVRQAFGAGDTRQARLERAGLPMKEWPQPGTSEAESDWAIALEFGAWLGVLAGSLLVLAWSVWTPG